MLLLLVGALGCAGSEDSTPDDPQTGPDTDSPPVKVDTALALVYLEGAADLTPDTWTGEESQVATSYDGAVEHCRVVNHTEGVPSGEPCPGCAFAFDVTFSAGTAEGEACENVYLTADMMDGVTLSYGFAPTWVGSTGYAYENVLLYGYDAGGDFEWVPWAYAEADDQDSQIDYEAIYAYTTYYYYW